MKADILIFVEVGYVTNENAQLENFYLCSSAFLKVKCRGYLLYVKNYLASKAIFIWDNMLRMNKKDIEIFILKICNIGVVGVYESPDGELKINKKKNLIKLISIK